MAGIPLSDAGDAILYNTPSWAKGGKAIAGIKRRSFPKGETPAHLQQFTDDFAQAARTCANQTSNLSGADRVQAMNGCVAERLRQGSPVTA